MRIGLSYGGLGGIGRMPVEGFEGGHFLFCRYTVGVQRGVYAFSLGKRRIIVAPAECNAPDRDGFSRGTVIGCFGVGGTSGQIQYASPMEADSLKHFPKTYVEVAEFDCLHDEGVAFAERLQLESISVELHEVKGACHGYEAAIKSTIVTDSLNKRIKWIRFVFD